MDADDAFLNAKPQDAQDADDAFLNAPPDEGALMAAGRGALRNFPLAQQAVAAVEPGAYSHNIQDFTQKAEAAKAAHPAAYGTGAVLGTAAPMAIPGIGEALGAGEVLAPALEVAGGAGALGGGLNATAQSLSDADLTKMKGSDYLNAGLSGAIGAGLGKFFAPAAKAAPEAAEAAAPKVAEEAAEPIEEVAQKAAPMPPPSQRQPLSQVSGLAVPNKKVAPDFTPSAQRVYASNLAQGLGGTPRQLIKVFGKENPVSAMNDIGNWMDSAGEGGKSLHEYLDRPGELLQKIEDLHDDAGKTIGGIVEDMGKSPKAALDRQGLWQDLNEASMATADPQTAARIDRIRDQIPVLAKKNFSDFDILQKLKGMAGEQVRKDPEMSPIYGKLADRMTQTVDAYGQAIKDPGQLAAYMKARTDYHNASRILPILRYAEAKDLTGGPAGHHTLRGLLSTIINMGTAVSGLPPVEQIAKNVALKSAPVARNIVQAATKPILGTAKTAPNYLSRAAQLELANALQNKFKK